jgi:two-component system nitrogen regulation sensor histidine kinase NtrY
MELPEQLLKHRKDDRFIAAGLLLLLLVFSLFYYLLQRGKGLSAVMATDKLLLFVLWYINIILILAILFVLVRNLFRLVLERHNRILGSKFKSKLVASAIGLSLIPVLILFPFATRILIDSFDQWFSLPVEEVLSQAAETANALSRQIETTNLRDARRVLREVAELDLEDLGQRPALQHRLQELREELQLHYLALYDGTEYIHGTADVLAGFRSAPKLQRPTRFLDEAIDKGEAIRVEGSLDIDGRLILAAASAVREDGEEQRPHHTVVVAGTVLPPDIAEQSESLLLAYQDYLKLSVRKQDIRTFYLLLLLMVTLLVVLAFSSIGMRLARRLTEPVQALAAATDRIGRGDLDYQVEVAVDDELGVLIDGFNHMTGELKRNRELVDRRNRELVEAHKQIAAVLQSVAAGVISIDAGGKILTCNGAALEILHQREDEVIGQPIHQAWADGERDKLVLLLEEDFTAGGLIDRQLRMTVGGVWKTLEVKVKTLPGSKGQPGGRVVVLEDLTELIYAQKMATWNEVARRIAHEIKNPLTPIKLTAERLLRKHRQADPELGKNLERGVETIVREVSTLKNLVDEFSRFARMPRPQPQEIDLEQLASEMLGLYQGLKPGVEVESHIAPEAATVRFDPEQLKSVLINLLDNAIEATEAPGRVSLSAARADGHVHLNVADTGRGIPPEDREKLFLPYYSTKGRGTGLGLSIVHRIVTDHNASIHIEDNRPRGAVFRLEIPLQ